MLSNVPVNILSGESLEVEFLDRPSRRYDLVLFDLLPAVRLRPVDSNRSFPGQRSARYLSFLPSRCRMRSEPSVLRGVHRCSNRNIHTASSRKLRSILPGRRGGSGSGTVRFQRKCGGTASTTASVGGWERAVPSTDSISVNDCSAPGSDSDGSGSCWVTGNGLSTFGCEFDIDGGQTQLTSAIYAPRKVIRSRSTGGMTTPPPTTPSTTMSSSLMSPVTQVHHGRPSPRFPMVTVLRAVGAPFSSRSVTSSPSVRDSRFASLHPTMIQDQWSKLVSTTSRSVASSVKTDLLRCPG